MTKILYIEDEIFLGKIVKESLEARNYLIHMETDGAKAVDAFQQFEPDICVLDIMLPNKNGYEIAADIRKLQANIPILFLSAKTLTNDVVKGFAVGGNDYIRKPFSLEELIVRIENLLKLRSNNIAGNSNNQDLVLGKYLLQVPKQQLVNPDKTIRKLSYRETALLQYLFMEKEAIIDRRALMEYIWGNDSFFNSRNLDVYITKLRNYLKDDAQIEILTVKGIGYRFITP